MRNIKVKVYKSSAKLKKDDHDAYRSLHNMMQWGSNQDDFRNSLNGIKNDLMKAGRGEGSKSEEWALADEIGDLNNATHYKLDDAAEAYANMSPEAQELIADAMAKANESITINGKQGRTGTEEIKVINGKKYRAITESIDKRISVKEVHKWLKGLEEYRYRKIPGVDARRITSFVNNGLSETDLPASLQKKWGNAKYSREKHLADKFVKERISRKLAQNESNHPLKEQYNKLFKNKVVL